MSNDLEDIGQSQRSSHATHLLMLVIICIKYGKNPSRTVDATEQTRFSKSRPNDLEDIGQGQGSSLATHPLMLLIICTKYGKNPSWTVDATGRTRKVNRQTDRQTGRQTGWIQYTPPTSLRGVFRCGGIINHYNMTVWILAGNYISFTIAAGLIRLHMPGVKKSRV